MFGFLGFGKGKIEIQLNNFNYALGDVIEGTLSLSLKKPLLGKEVSILLLAEQESTKRTGNDYTTQTCTLFDFKQSLSGQKEYGTEVQSFPFKIKIPATIKPKFGSALETAIKVAQALSGKDSRTKWYLIGRLDVKGFDITKKVAIHVG